MIRYVVCGYENNTGNHVVLDTYHGWGLVDVEGEAAEDIYDIRFFRSKSEAKKARKRALRLFPGYTLHVDEACRL